MPFSILTRPGSAAAPAPPAPPLGCPPRPGLFFGSAAAPRLAMFRTPSGFRISVMAGRWSVRSPNSTRPARSPSSFSASRPVSSLRKGAESNFGSSATSRLCSLTAGPGSTDTETEVNLTGRPSACDAVETISAWTRGVSTTSGSARAAAITRRASAAATTTIHVKVRFTAHPPAELRGLDGREAPGLRAHEAREGPVLLDVLRRLRTVHERASTRLLVNGDKRARVQR